MPVCVEILHSLFKIAHVLLWWTTGYKWSQDLLGHLAEMDVTEPKENRVARERLDPRDLLVLLKDKRENLGSRVPPAREESEGRKGRVEIQERLNFVRI